MSASKSAPILPEVTCSLLKYIYVQVGVAFIYSWSVNDLAQLLVDFSLFCFGTGLPRHSDGAAMFV